MEVPLLDTAVLQIVQISCVSLSPLLSDVHHLREGLMVPRCPGSAQTILNGRSASKLSDSDSALGSSSQNGKSNGFIFLFYAIKKLSIVFLKNIGPSLASWQDTSLRKCRPPTYTGSPL